ncbi:MAG: hypothetical protein B7Y80_20185 [Hyphomicrobium sp. 32-62-53]|nr:MAG: hypothetical protein B7Z29_20040 [Hyphomicrobium sp. 12-62-95]OYX97308.1 MAG: hypothetical protein B7Y80_20185 [Hyphomicrobium sp. 32-62-53]
MPRDLLKSGLSVTVLRGANVVLGFAVILILTRVLGPEGLGAYAFATTLLLLLGIPVSYGWAPLLLREAARALHTGHWASVKGMAVRGTQLAVAFTGLGFFAGMGVLWTTDMPSAGLATVSLMAVLSITLLFEQLSALRTSILRGLGFAVNAQVPEMVIKPAVQLALLTIAVATWFAALDVQLALGVLAVAAIVSFAVGAIILQRLKPAALANAAPQFDDSQWLKTSALFASSAAVSVLNANADLLLLGLLRGTTDVGYYKVALQVALAGALAYTSLNMIAVQRFATASASGDRKELQQTATHLARLALVPALATLLLLLAVGEQIIPVAFGADFAPSLTPMIILSAAQLVNAASGMGRSLLMMSGHENKAMLWAGVGLTANIIICLLLIPAFGAAGAATGHLVSLTLWNGGIWWEVWRSNDVDASALGLKK